MKTIIAAIDRNNAIGFGNDLPWGRSLKDDLANFKRLTVGGSIVMGRKTFESIGSKALPDRENIVLSSQPTGVPGVLTALSIEAAFALARNDVYIIGGGNVYDQTIADVDKLIITHVDEEFSDADVYFPRIDDTVWHEVAREQFAADDRNKYAFDIVTYEKR